MAPPRKKFADVEEIKRANGRVVYRGRYRDLAGVKHSTDICETPEEAYGKQQRAYDDIHGTGSHARLHAGRSVPRTIGALSDEFRAQLAWASSTRSAYDRTLDDAVAWFGSGRRVVEIERRDVRAWLDHLADDGNGYETRQNKLSHLRKMFQYALDELRLITWNVCNGIDIKRVEADWKRTARRRCPTTEEVDAAAKAMPWWLEAAVYIGAHSGLRSSELAALQWEDINFETHELFVGHMIDSEGRRRPWTKFRGGPKKDGDGQAWVPMSARSEDALRRLREARPGGPSDRVFRARYGDTIEPATLSARWRDARKKALDPDLPPVRLHDLRHYFATRAADGNIPLVRVGEVMRHSSVAMTKRYVDKADRAALHAQYDAVFN